MARAQIRADQILDADILTEAEHATWVHENLLTSGTLNFQDGTISGAGNIYAAAYYGDGSNLTGIAFSTDWIEVTTSYSGSINDHLMVDTTVSGIEITLPSSPNFGDTLVFMDGAGNAAVNNVSILRNGNKIMGLNEDLTVNEDSAAFDLVYYNATNGWRIK